MSEIWSGSSNPKSKISRFAPNDLDPIYTYDLNGNRTSMIDLTGLTTYTNDALNRLAQAVNPLPPNPLETFNYEPVGNRINSNQNGSSVEDLHPIVSVSTMFGRVFDSGCFNYIGPELSDEQRVSRAGILRRDSPNLPADPTVNHHAHGIADRSQDS